MHSSQLLQDLQRRYATKQFDAEKKLSEEQVNQLMESVRLAPSSYGLQPWKFVVVQNQVLKEQLLPHAYSQSQVVDASHVVVLCLKKNFWEEDVDRYVQDIVETRQVVKDDLLGFRDMMVQTVTWMSLEQRTQWMQKQVYLALWFLLSSAAHLQIDACPMEWFQQDQFDQILWLEDYQSVVICPIGYRSESDKYATAKKVRYDSEKVIEWR